MIKACHIAAFFAVCATAFAGTHKIPPGEGIATVQTPDKWKTNEKGELVEAISPDGSVCFLIIPVERRKVAESMGEAMRYIRGVGAIVVDPKSLVHTTGKVKDADAEFVSWKGKNKSGDVEIKFSIFSPDLSEPLLAAYWGPPAAIKKHQSGLDKMLQSVRKAEHEKSQDRQ
jgi:hypothetical protein